jgi:hypothetical protein
MDQKLLLKSFLCLGLFSFLFGCSSKDKDLEEAAERDRRTPKTQTQRMQDKTKGYIFGEPLFGIGSKKPEDTNIGVNSYLWRASLDTLSSLPKIKADPFGGMIITDWQILPEDETERLKIEIIIIGRQLRSDALKVSIFRQHLNKGIWEDAPVSKETLDEIEETILKRARDIRIQEEK